MSALSIGVTTGGPMAPELAPYAVRDIPFKFQLGDVTLFQVRRRMAHRALSLEECRRPVRLVLPELDHAADGVIIRSLPVPPAAAIDLERPPFLTYVTARYPRHFAELTSTFEEYMARLSGKTRATLRRKLRRFERASEGEIDFREYRTAAEMLTFHELARHLSRKTYQERLLGIGLPDSDASRKQMVTLAQHGAALGFLLFLHGRPVSYLYTPIEHGCAIYTHLGYDPEYAGYSPGTVLQLLVMQHLFADRTVRMFDFNEGDGQHKRLFATASIPCANVAYLKPTLENRLLVATHGSFNGVANCVVGVLHYLRIKAYIRRTVRRYAKSFWGHTAN